MQEANKTSRIYGIDLLRLICMLMVVIIHILLHTGLLAQQTNNTLGYNILYGLDILCFCAVNCYGMITGYIYVDKQIKFKNLIKLLLMVLFYSITITLIFKLILPHEIRVKNIIISLFPMTFKQYWFFTAYFAMYLFLPFINIMIKNITKKQFDYLIICILIIFSLLPTLRGDDIFITNYGLSPLWLTCCYIIGAWSKKRELNLKNSENYVLIYFLCATIVLASRNIITILKGHALINNLSESVLQDYTSPIILLMAWLLLKIFKDIKVNKITKILQIITPSIFSIYLIHNHPLIKQYIYTQIMTKLLMNIPVFTQLIIVLGLAILIVLFCLIIDIVIRKTLFRISKIDKGIDKIENKLINTKQ